MDVKAIQQTQTVQEMNSLSADTLTQAEKSSKKEFDLDKLDQESKKKVLEDLAKNVNDKFELMNLELKIEIDEDTKIKVVKFIEPKNKEVIKQIPPEELLKIAKYIDEMIGILFEKRV